MGDHGIKVSQPGFDVKTATPSQLVFSSKYQTLKVKQQGSGVITHDGGRTATIPHNLGYVPMFLVHTTSDPVYETDFWGDASDFFINPVSPGVFGACNIDRAIISWADTANLYIKVRPDFGWYYSYTRCVGADYADESDGPYTTGYMYFGNWWGREDGAIRFTNIRLNKNESFYKADLLLYIAVKGGAGDVKAKVYGINEDNTLPYDEGSEAFVRGKTTNFRTWQTGEGAGTTVQIDIADMVGQITSRAGWGSGNAMGWLFFDNETAEDVYIGEAPASCNPYCSPSSMRILKSNTLMDYKYTIYLNEVNP